MDYEEIVEYILSIPKFAPKTGADNLNVILESFNHPEKRIKTIHVAGTNGKGSTSYFLSNLLMKQGYNVGLFTSPHLVDINERFRVNNIYISNEEFVDVYRAVKTHIDELMLSEVSHPSFFEFLFIICACWFEKQDLDYVIYETGLGGRLDATNIISPELSIITSVDFDHMQYLGDTIEKIAFEKAGIIKKHKPVVFFDRNNGAGQIIKDIANQNDCKVYAVDKSQYYIDKIADKTIDFSFNSGYYKYDNVKIRKNAIYQVENSILAIVANNVLTGNKLSQDDINEVLSVLVWEGRMEEIKKDVIVDGAHNIEAILSFCDTLNACYTDKKIDLLFAVANDKQYDGMIKALCDKLMLHRVYVTSIEGSRLTPVTYESALFEKYCDVSVNMYKDIETAYEASQDNLNGENRLFCVGSLYLIGKIKEIENIGKRRKI